ncbi:MAG: hypothetical protein JO131_07180 [Gammaproteobacteria bacterium]|nr:hypothetical protein [Gammaproteobacteria bacterium]
MNIVIKKYVGELLFLSLLLFLAIIHFYQKNLLAYTGDEPRFTYYSYSIIKGSPLKYPINKFKEETESIDPSHTIYDAPITINIFNKTMFMMNSIVAPLLYSPALFFKHYHAWLQLRTAAFIFYLSSLVFIWLSLKSIFTTKQSILALAITALSLPQLAQMSLANTEQVTLFFITSAFYFLIFRKISPFSIFLGTISLFLIIWSCMRAGAIAAPLGLGFLVRVWWASSNSIQVNKIKYITLFIIIAFLGVAGWVVLQKSFTGTIFGSSILTDSLYEKSFAWFIYHLFTPILNHKNGIFLLFPLVFASLLGLINAAKNGETIAWISLIAWICYYFLISLTDQSEGYPGRLQFILIEFFVIGLAFYIRDFKNVGAIFILIAGILFSTVVIYIHLRYPTILIQNREFGLFQQLILEKTSFLDIGKYIIWDEHSSSYPYTKNPLFFKDAWHIIFKISIFCLTLGFLLMISINKRLVTINHAIISSVIFVLVITGFFSFITTPVKVSNFSLESFFTPKQGKIELTFNKPISGFITITFGLYPFWQHPSYPSYFIVSVKKEDGSITQYQKRSIPEIRLSSIKNVKSITIIGDEATENWSILPIKIYTSVAI